MLSFLVATLLGFPLSQPDRRGVLRLAGAALASSPAVRSASAAPTPGPITTLSTGEAFPLASFGLQIYDDATAEKLTRVALDEGYRNFFASVLAGNQRGFAKAVAASSVPRSDLFICGSVVSNRADTFSRAYELTKRGCQQNVEAFAVGGIKTLDMIMLDYPALTCDAIRGQWSAFEEMKAAGLVRTLAVSNFSPSQLDCILGVKGATPPLVNQLPYSVSYNDPTAVAANAKRGVLVQAWSPLAAGRLPPSARQACAEVGEKYGKSAQQVALRWIVQSGAAFTTQTKKREHFKEDLELFDFELSADEMKALGKLRIDPQSFN